MPEALSIPDLTFPSLRYGARETPWDLQYLLYKGGAKANTSRVASLIRAGSLKQPILERLDFVQRLHAEINGRLVGGGSRGSAETQIRAMRLLYAWSDENDYPLTVDTIKAT